MSKAVVMEPVVVYPMGFNIAEEWHKQCKPCMEALVRNPDNIAAAFGADPGICSCPACQQMYEAWGDIQRCKECRFEYPTDAWAMYSYGVQEARRQSGFRLKQRLNHPYYRYGYEHPVEEPWEEFHKIDWKTAIPKRLRPGLLVEASSMSTI